MSSEPSGLVDGADAGRSIAECNEGFQSYGEEDIDLCISTGPPLRGGMADTDIGIMPEDMLVVTNLEFRYDPAQVEEWITRGEVDGVTLYPTRSREELLLITEETLEDLPSESPL